MVEGSGFLQCLSVLALSLSEDLDLILLDEPDAHLNASLQKELVDNLILYSGIQRKQIFLATHSPELIRTLDYERIMFVGNGSAKYLKSDAGKISALSGIGTTHTLKLNKLIECKKILIVEGESDERFLKGFATAMGVEWPKELVTWFWVGKAAERARLFEQLRSEISGLCGISIRDRDDEPDGTVNNLLEDGSYTAVVDGLLIRKWRRRHIENYLLSKAAIASAAGVDIGLVSNFFTEKHGLNIPDDPTPTDILMPIRDARGKEIFTDGESLKQEFSITRDQVINAMGEADVPDDIKTLITEICNL
jgi:energy-coupling factor transporter ATP-binding protein EcfA2